MNRLGLTSALALFAIGVGYAIVTGIGIAGAGDAPIKDPTLAVMEGLTLLSAPPIVVLFAAIHVRAAPAQKTWSLVAFGFALIMAALTASVHFVGLSTGRQSGEWLLQWPSVAYAIELLAWDLFLGLALLFASFALGQTKGERRARWALAIAGALSLVGTIGPLAGDMALQRLGIVGYGAVLPVAWAMLAATFWNPHHGPTVDASPAG